MSPQPASYRLDTGTVAVVTGAAGRFGLCIARTFHSAGAAVVLVDLDAGRLTEITDELNSIRPASATAIPADLTAPAVAAGLVNTAVSAHGRVDVLVNCAGQLGGSHFLDYDEAALRSMIDLNLTAALLCSHAAARVMAAGKGGTILHIGSVGSVRGHADAVPYDASKGGLDAAARAMAVDLALHDIRVNVIAPSRPATPESAEPPALGSGVVLPEDVANLAVFLASGHAVRITGQVIFVDNGLTATLRP